MRRRTPAVGGALPSWGTPFHPEEDGLACAHGVLFLSPPGHAAGCGGFFRPGDRQVLLLAGATRVLLTQPDGEPEEVNARTRAYAAEHGVRYAEVGAYGSVCAGVITPPWADEEDVVAQLRRAYKATPDGDA